MIAAPRLTRREQRISDENAYQARLRRSWRSVLRTHHWDLIATLTYRGRRTQSSQVIRELRQWQDLVLSHTAVSIGLGRWRDEELGRTRGKYQNARRRKSPVGTPTFFVVVEGHADGNLHIHALLKAPPMLGSLDPRVARQMWEQSQARGGMGLGNAKCEFVRDPFGATRYLAKTAAEFIDFDCSPDLFKKVTVEA